MNLKQLLPVAQAFCSECRDDFPDNYPVLVISEDRPRSIDATVYEPVICLILQGAKETGTRTSPIPLTPGDMLLVTHDMPVTARITEASPEAPYLAAVVRLDFALLRRIAEETGTDPRPAAPASSGALSRFRATPALLDALGRFLALRPGTAEARVLTGATLREIHFRLLDGPGGAALEGLLRPGGHAARIARAIAEIRRNHDARLTLPDLARIAGMGQSTFHLRFREITGTSPLQYQKDIRLTEAHRLLTEEGHPVGAAAFAVGYESAAQFSREYARKFGVPPSRHRGAEARVA